ncbi:MAG: diguanylate cyclase [Sphingomonadaceae bacterium]|nr:diguanylate cyclase [Sphingomonadaceae bacterium]
MPHRARSTQPSLRQVLARAHRRLILFAVLLAGGAIMFSGFAVMQSYAARNLALVARTLSYTVEPAILFGDADALRDGTLSIAGTDMVGRVEIVARDGKPLLNWTRPYDGLIDEIERPVGRLLWPDAVIGSVRRNDVQLAEIRIYGSAGGIGRYLLSSGLVALACLGLILLAGRMLAKQLDEGVVAPLDRIAQVAHDVRANRALHRRAPISGLAEVDNFIRDFNLLLAELEGWHQGLAEENAQLARRATQDALTGIGNRALFEQRLEEMLAEAARTGQSLGLLYCDANDFKLVNDRHGHEAGDVILKTIAARLQVVLGSNDVAFRLGGDEFAVLLPGLDDAMAANRLIDRLHMAMTPMVRLPDGHKANIVLSAGFAHYPAQAREADELVRLADAAMYRDKNRKRKGADEEAHDENSGSAGHDVDGGGVPDDAGQGIHRPAGNGTAPERF